MVDIGSPGRLRALANTALTHKWWLGISGIAAVAAVVVAVSLPPGSPSVKAGDCNAQGSDNSVTCINSVTPPAVEGVDYFRQSSDFFPGDNTGLFALPPDVDLTTFPGDPGSYGFCDDDDMAWLERHSIASQSNMVTMRNAGTTGAILHLANLRVEELTSSTPRPVIWFECASAGNDDTVEAFVHLTEGGRIEVDKRNGEALLPGQAFSFSLAPGEGGVLIAHLLGGESDYAGKLVVTVEYGEARQDVVLQLGNQGETFNVPGGARSITISPPQSATHPFHCHGLTDDDDDYGCGISEIRSMVS
ncbi:hypothetical protein [Asanoa iriomotensis]|uniref:hypothetical protein n=2 Tax=Asanoa iriomotensis TaxID=234613 RepID=UPI0031CE32B9